MEDMDRNVSAQICPSLDIEHTCLDISTQVLTICKQPPMLWSFSSLSSLGWQFFQTHIIVEIGHTSLDIEHISLDIEHTPLDNEYTSLGISANSLPFNWV